MKMSSDSDTEVCCSSSVTSWDFQWSFQGALAFIRHGIFIRIINSSRWIDALTSDTLQLIPLSNVLHWCHLAMEWVASCDRFVLHERSSPLS